MSTVNILTDSQKCARKCRYSTGVAFEGDVRRCEHGKWWVSTGKYMRGSFLSVWRHATWFERRRIRRFITKEDT